MKAILITSSILIAALAAFRRLLRGRVRPQVQYALWLIVAIRLLVPLETFPSAFSALALLDRAEEPARVAQAIGQTAVPVPAMSYEDAFDQALSEIQKEQTVTTSFTDLDRVEHRAKEIQAKQPTLAELAAKYARPVWLGGAILMALWFLLVNARLRRRLGMAELLTMNSGLPVFVSDVLPSPCLCGTFRPAIYVTPYAAEDPDRLRHVLAHELTHYRHRDHWWALVRCACLCVYWFDPLVWWAAAMSRQDCELACDAGAIRRLGEAERLSYGRTLVAMIAEGRTPLLQTATTMTGSKRRVKERVELIARRPKTVAALSLAAALLMGLVVGCTFTSAPKEPSDLTNRDPAPLSSGALNTATLPARLLAVPDELYTEVDALSGGTDATVLAEYWMHRSWTDHPTGMGWLLTVYQWDQEQFEQRYSVLTGQFHSFARSGEFYYVIQVATDIRYPREEMDAYRADLDAIWAFVQKTVLETEGVEPYDGNPPQPLATLEARLLGVPEDLQADVRVLRGGESTVVESFAPSVLAQYWMNRPYTDYQEGWGWLLAVYQWDQKQFEENYFDGGGILDCFARDDNYYYVLARATDVRVPASEEMVAEIPGATEVETGYQAAFEGVRAYAKKTVLETEGVESFDPHAAAAQAVQSIADQLLAAPVIELYLSLDSVGYPRYATEALQDPSCGILQYLSDSFQWEEFDWGTTEDPHFPQPNQHNQLSIHTPYDSEIVYVRVYQDSDLVAVHDTETGTNWYHATDSTGVTPFEYLKRWYDRLYSYSLPRTGRELEPTLVFFAPTQISQDVDYTLRTDPNSIPSDPEEWYLVGQLPGESIWMFSRDHGEETMFQVGERFTQAFPYRAHNAGHAIRLPQLRRLEAGPNGGAFAVISHLFQGGTEQEYQLTAYDLETDPVTPCVHDWRALMEDFNRNRTVELDKTDLTATITYEGQTVEIDFHDEDWYSEADRTAVQQHGFSPAVYEYDMDYVFNPDGTADLRMPVTLSHMACWTLRFTGSGFEIVDFQFVEGNFWR